VSSKIGPLFCVHVFDERPSISRFLLASTLITFGDCVLSFDCSTADAISLVVATKRIQRFLLRGEIDSFQVLREKYDESSGGPVVEIENATLAWTSGKAPEDADSDDDNDGDEEGSGSEDQRPRLSSQEEDTGDHSNDSDESVPPEATLSNITLSVRDKSLTAVVGRVGQGKSSLLSAIIGEMYKLEGTIRVRGRVAYVPQQAFIMNTTVRDNIVFGNVFDQDRYRRVLTACGLEPDLTSLPAGDMTEIGERGINLSGGQKQRVSLARATYDNADIYLLDDPLSAVDAHVDRHLWDNLIGPEGLLKDKTRILVTHGIHHLEHVDQIVVIRSGEIAELGRYQELVDAKQSFYQLMREYSTKHPRKRKGSHAIIDGAMASESAIGHSATLIDGTILIDSASGTDMDSDLATVEEDFPASSAPKVDDGELDDEEEGELIAEEIMKKGGIEQRLVKAYAKACGPKIALTVTLLLVLGELCTVWINLWLKHWVDKSREELTASMGLFMGIFLALVLLYVVVHMIFVYLIFAVARIRASELLHCNLLSTIIRLPMRYVATMSWTVPMRKGIGKDFRGIFLED